MSLLSPLRPQTSLRSRRTARSSTELLTRVQRYSSRMSCRTVFSLTSVAWRGQAALARTTAPCHSIRQESGTPSPSLFLQLSSMKWQFLNYRLSSPASLLKAPQAVMIIPSSSQTLRGSDCTRESLSQMRFMAETAAYWNSSRVCSEGSCRNLRFQSMEEDLDWLCLTDREGSSLNLDSFWLGSMEMRDSLMLFLDGSLEGSFMGSFWLLKRESLGLGRSWLALGSLILELRMCSGCSCRGGGACSSGLRMDSLRGFSCLVGWMAASSVSCRKAPPFWPVIWLTILSFSSSNNFIHSLARSGVSQVKFHSTVSISPLPFLPVCLTCISLVPEGFLKVEDWRGVETLFLGSGTEVRKGVFLQSLLQKRMRRVASQTSRRSLDRKDMVFAYFLTREQQSVVSLTVSRMSWDRSQVQLYFIQRLQSTKRWVDCINDGQGGERKGVRDEGVSMRLGLMSLELLIGIFRTTQVMGCIFI